jgi:hypothetical protein
VEVSPESILRITAPHYKKNWQEDKLNHITTSKLYKGLSPYLMGFETCTRLLFLGMIIACLAVGIITQNWMTIGIASLLWMLRFLMQLVVFHKTSKALGEQKFYSTLLLFDWMQPLWNLRFRIQQRFSRKDEFMRK